MEVVDCRVAIGGDVRMIVEKQNVSIPELVLLQTIHGRDAIKDVKVSGKAVNFNPAAEAERLRSIYDSPSEEGFHVEKVFPGHRPDFPTQLSEIVLVDPVDEDTATAQPLEVVRFDNKQRPVRSASVAPAAPLPDDDDAGADDLDDEPDGVDPPELDLTAGAAPASSIADVLAPPATPAPPAPAAGDGTHLLD